LSKNTQTRNFIKIHPLGAEFFHADGGKHRARYEEANSLFFMNTPNNCITGVLIAERRPSLGI